MTWRENIRTKLFPYAETGNSGRGWFEYVVFCLLVCVIVTAPLHDFEDITCKNARCQVLISINGILNLFFSIEIFLHLCAFGLEKFYHPLRALDFFAVIGNLVWISLFLSGITSTFPTLLIFRTVRIYRPLFTSTYFTNMRLFVVSLLQSMMQLTDVALLFLLLIVWYAVAGTNQIGGALLRYCVHETYFNTSSRLVKGNSTVDTIDSYRCGIFDVARARMEHNLSNFSDTIQLDDVFPFGCSPFQTCESETSILPKYRCPAFYQCVDIPTSYYGGYIGFDNMLRSLLTVFVSVSQELWYQLMFLAGGHFMSQFFFITVTVVGGIFVTQLTTVIISVEFEKNKETERKRIVDSQIPGDFGVLDSVAAVVHRILEARVQDGVEDEGEASSLSWIRLWIEVNIVKTRWMRLSSIGAIFGNIVIMCLEYHGMPDELTRALQVLNYFFAAFFSIELVLYAFASRDIRAFWKKKSTWVDLTVVVGAWADIIIAAVWRHVPVIGALRSVRIFRIFTLFPSIYVWIKLFGAALAAAPSVGLLFIFFIFIFSCFGLNTLGGSFCSSVPANTLDLGYPPSTQCDTPRANFNGFWMSFITSLQIATADDWELVMFSAMKDKHVLFVIPFCLFFYVCSFALLPVLVGIVLSAKEGDTVSASSLAKLRQLRTLSVANQRPTEDNDDLLREKNDFIGRRRFAQQRLQTELNARLREEALLDVDAEVDMEFSGLSAIRNRLRLLLQLLDDGATRISQRFLVRWVPCFFTFSRKCKSLRLQGIYRLLVSIIYVYGIVIISMDDPRAAPDSKKSTQFFIMETIFCILAGVDIFLSFFANGFIFSQGSYLRSSTWNKSEIVIWLSATAWLFLFSVPLRTPSVRLCQRIFRLVRDLRPLLIIRHAPGPASKALALGESAVHLKRVGIVCFAVILLFAIEGVRIFRGRLRVCFGGAQNATTLDLCESSGGVWENDGSNFDNIGSALFALFSMTTLEGWADITYRLVDRSDSPGLARVRDNSPVAAAFTISFILLSLLIVNMFVSVLVDAFNRQRRLSELSVEEEQDDQAYLLTQRRIFRALPVSEQKKVVQSNPETLQVISFEIVSKIVPASAIKEVQQFGSIISSKARIVKDQLSNGSFEFSLNGSSSQNFPLQHSLLDNFVDEGPPTRLRTLVDEDSDLRHMMVKSHDSPTSPRNKSEPNNFLAKFDMSSFYERRSAMRGVVRSSLFLNAMHVVVFVNVLVMTGTVYPENPRLVLAQNILDIIFVFAFIIEAALKVVAETTAGYFASNWNRLDFFILIVNIVNVVVTMTTGGRHFSLFTTIRLVRLLRLADGKLQIRILISRLSRALVGMIDMGIIFICTCLAFSFIGRDLFGRIQPKVFGETSGIDIHSNFATTSNAMLLLMRIVTGGNWPNILFSCKGDPLTTKCEEQLGFCGVPSPIPEIYFLLFIFCAFFVLKNLFVAILIDSFSSSGHRKALTNSDVTVFCQCWFDFDKEATLVLKPVMVLAFIRSLPSDIRLGFNHMRGRKRVTAELSFFSRLRLSSQSSDVSFGNVVDLLCLMTFDSIRAPPPSRIFQTDLRDGNEPDLYCRNAAGVLIGGAILSYRRRIAEKKRNRLEELQTLAFD